VRKVNIDTDIRLAMTGAIRRQFMVGETLGVRPARVQLAGRATAAKRHLQGALRGVRLRGAWRAKIKPLSLDRMAERYRKGELNQIVR
jgi:fructose-bisphosphate aldolase, class II